MKKKGIVSMVLIVAIVMAIGLSTFAWFIINREVDVRVGDDDIEITCEAGNSIDISIDGDDVPNNEKTFGRTAKLDKSGYSQTNMVSGDGLHLYRASHFDEETEEPSAFVVAEPGVGSQTNNEPKEGDYVEFKLTFRTSIDMRVFLSQEAYVLPVSEERNGSHYPFSKDYIAGAARVAFLRTNPETSQNTLSYVWAPNENYELSNDGPEFSFNKYGDPEKLYYYYDNNGYKQSITPEQMALKKFVAGDIRTTTQWANNSAEVAFLKPEPGYFAYETITVRVWVEGTDREAKVALGGGKFKVYLKFFGLNKNDALKWKTDYLDRISTPGTPTNPSSEILGLGTEFNGQLLFSRNGQQWTVYTSWVDQGVYYDNLGAAFTGHEYLCLKYPETENEFETYINILRFYKQPGGGAPVADKNDTTNKIIGLVYNESLYEISYDDGRKWVDYSSDMFFHGDVTVWIRIKETSTTYESDPFKLIFTKNIQEEPSGFSVNKTDKYISGVNYSYMEIAISPVQLSPEASAALSYEVYINRTDMTARFKNYSDTVSTAFYVYIRYRATDILAASTAAEIYFNAYL